MLAAAFVWSLVVAAGAPNGDAAAIYGSPRSEQRQVVAMVADSTKALGTVTDKADHIAVAADGTVVVGDHNVLRVAPPGAKLEPAETVPLDNDEYIGLRFVTNRAGDTLACSRRRCSLRPAGGRFGAPRSLRGAPSRDDFVHDLALADDGTAAVAVSGNSDRRLAIYRAAPGEPFGPAAFPFADMEGTGVALAFGNRGELAVAVDAWRISVSVTRPGEPFGPPVTVPSSPGDSTTELLVGADGRMTLVWQELYLFDPFGFHAYSLYAAHSTDSGATFSAPQLLRDFDRFALDDWQAARDGAGTVTVAWGKAGFPVETVSGPVGAPLGARRVLAGALGRDGGPALAAHDGGTSVLWRDVTPRATTLRRGDGAVLVRAPTYLPRPSDCAQDGSRTVVRSRHVRVFRSAAGRLVACHEPTGRRLRVRAAFGADTVAVAGHVLAYPSYYYFDLGIVARDETDLHVHDFRTGDEPAGLDPGDRLRLIYPDPDFGEVAVAADGALAYTTCPRPRGCLRVGDRVQVRALAPGEVRPRAPLRSPAGRKAGRCCGP